MGNFWNGIRSLFITKREIERLRERYWEIWQAAHKLKPSKVEAEKAFLIKSVVKPRDGIKVYLKSYYPIFSPYPTDEDGDECDFPTIAEERDALLRFIAHWEADTEKRFWLTVGMDCYKDGRRLGAAEDIPRIAELSDDMLREIYQWIYSRNEKEFDAYRLAQEKGGG